MGELASLEKETEGEVAEEGKWAEEAAAGAEVAGTEVAEVTVSAIV